jgi:hypothetical protein
MAHFSDFHPAPTLTPRPILDAAGRVVGATDVPFNSVGLNHTVTAATASPRITNSKTDELASHEFPKTTQRRSRLHLGGLFITLLSS